MDGIRSGDVTLFLTRMPDRKQECFCFQEGTVLYPVAYISQANSEQARRLWAKMLETVSPREE